MKKNILAILLLIISNTFLAQTNIEIKYGALSKEKYSNVNLLDGIYHKDNYYIVRGIYSNIKPYAKYFKIEKYDINFNLLHSYMLENTDHLYFYKSFIIEGNLNLLMLNSKRKYFSVERFKTKIDKFNFKKEVLYMPENSSLKTDDSFFSEFINNYNVEGDFDNFGRVSLSDNNKFFSLSFNLGNSDKEAHLVIGFNSKFEKLYENIFTKNIKDKMYLNRNIVISNTDGSTFFINKKYHKKRKEFIKTNKIMKANYHYEIYKINNNVKTLQLNNKNLLYRPLALSKSGKLYITGLYFDTSTKKPLTPRPMVPFSDFTFMGKPIAEFRSGFYKISIDENSFNNTEIKYTPFSEKIFKAKQKLYGKKAKRRPNIGDLTYMLKKIMLTENNDLIYFFEQILLMEYDKNRTRHYYKNVASVKINSKGEIEYVNAFKKSQNNVGKNYLATSCAFTNVNNTDYFLFNAKKVKKEKNNTVLFEGKKYLYKVEFVNGEMQYDKLETNDETTFFIRQHIVVSNGFIISNIQRKGKKGLALIKIKQ